MARIVLSAHEAERTEVVMRALDARLLEFLGDVRETLSRDDWDVLASYARARIRRSLEVGIRLHAVVDAQGPTEVAYAGRGRDAFVRGALAAWRDSFAPISDPWRLGAIFERIPGGERRVLADLDALELMAVDRMFRSFEQEYAELVADDSSGA